jgi:hypothetical protein
MTLVNKEKQIYVTNRNSMPVMIRNNDATELCITKGQEGYVVGWQSSDGPYQSKHCLSS